MLSGVAKSGSPISRWTIRLPSASSLRALASTSNAPSVPRRDMRSANRIAVLTLRRILSARVHVPVGDVLEAVGRLDRLVHVHPVHALRHRVHVVARVEEDRRRDVGHDHLEVDVHGQARGRVDHGATVLQVLSMIPHPRAYAKFSAPGSMPECHSQYWSGSGPTSIEMSAIWYLCVSK